MSSLADALALCERLNTDLSLALALGDGWLIEQAARQYADARELVGIARGSEASVHGIHAAFAQRPTP